MKSLKFNLIMNSLLTLSNILFPIITFPYVSRILQAEGVGKVTFITSIVAYFALFAQLGIPTYGIRACARARDDRKKLTKIVQELFLINLVMTIISYFTLLIVYFSVDRLREDGMLFLVISLTIIFNQFSMEWLYKGLEEYRYITIVSILFKTIALVMMFLFVKSADDYIIYGAISIFALSASSILNFINIRKHVDFYKISGGYEFVKHIRNILIFFALTCAITIYTNLDTVMLGFIHDDLAVGYYTTSIKIKAILLSVVTSLGVVVLPRLSYYVEKGNKQKFIELSNASFHFIIMISLSLTIYFIIYSKEVINFLAGSGFSESIIPMQIILPTVILIGITNLLGFQILVPLGKERLVLLSVLAGGVVNFTFNLILIPKYSYVGAAISNLLAEFTVAIVQAYFVRDILKEIVKGLNYPAVIFAVICSSIVSLFSRNIFQSDFLVLISSGLMFFFVYIVILRIVKISLIIDVEKQILKRIRK